MRIEDAIREIEDIASGTHKPHKLVMVLAIAQLIQEGKIKSNQIFFNKNLRVRFRELMAQYGSSGDRSRPCTPFFHLRTSKLWELVPVPGKEDELSETGTIGGPGRLSELVYCAKISQGFFEILREDVGNRKIQNVLVNLLTKKEAGSVKHRQDSSAPISMFDFEHEALRCLSKRLPSDCTLLRNLEIHESASNRYYEVDAVIVAPIGFYVVELKHWTGKIKVKPYCWEQNGVSRRDPHKVNNIKAKLLRQLYEQEFPTYPTVYVESVVVFTHPKAEIRGAVGADADCRNPTFADIPTFLAYLDRQEKSRAAILTPQQMSQIVKWLGRLQSVPRPKPDFQFPGYEIVERLYHGEDRAEVIARPMNLRHRRLTRLRIFFPPPSDLPAEIRCAWHERSTATLNAVAKVGEHPNILRVWDVPNDFGYVVEASLWSEDGTLRDLIAGEAPLPIDTAISLARGILQGLKAVHEHAVIHRYLSPENILVVGDVPKLMNFDLSYQLEDNRTTVIPDTSELKRSPYIAPEVYRGEDIAETADLFSLGVLLYEMLTGERPFACSTDLERTDGALDSTRLRRLQDSNVPEPVQRLICRLVQLDPWDRPQSAGEIEATLAEVQGGEEIPDHTINAVLSPGTRYDVYEILGLVTRGAESQIYRARGPKGNHLALKLFNRDVSKARILREEEMVRAVYHPSIVQAESVHLWNDGRYFIPFAWVEGESLWSQIEKSTRPTIERFRSVALALLDAIDSLHSHKPEPILHNDIKPENVLLTAQGHPVLIDFGAASHPYVGLYQGTEGYVPPNSIQGQDRDYCVQGDLYGAAATLYDWLFGVTPQERSRNADVRDLARKKCPGVSPALLDWFQKALDPSAEHRFNTAAEMRSRLEATLSGKSTANNNGAGDGSTYLPPPSSEVEAGKGSTIRELRAARIEKTRDASGNPFVWYLNRLHNADAANDNALAEFQATDEQFPHIHVEHPLVQWILDEFQRSDPRHVILTGHAGDGKSTIALAVYKFLKGLDPHKPLPDPMPRRAEATLDGRQIVLVKDFSEWTRESRADLLREVARTGALLLLVSNTGTLLDAFRAGAQDYFGTSREEVEDALLAALEAPKAEPTLGDQPLTLGRTRLLVYNLAAMDNLDIAREIFEKMLAPERWHPCDDCTHKEDCPVIRNVQLLNSGERIAVERLFLLYRRLVEYGERLTLRQLTGHFAYTITAGLDCSEVRSDPPMTKRAFFGRLFFNRFFGDDGEDIDLSAVQLAAVRTVRRADFGSFPRPELERVLWHRTQPPRLPWRSPEAEELFETLRQEAVRPGKNEKERRRAANLRKQVRRLLYCFLADGASGCDVNQEEVHRFLTGYLHSPGILKFTYWQKQGKIDRWDQNAFLDRILHVLQEHFAGTRLPARRKAQGRESNRIVITLSRRESGVYQTSQVVLAEYDRRLFKLYVPSPNSEVFRRPVPVLEVETNGTSARLPLPLPFLDYVMRRDQGFLADSLTPAFVERLNAFRGRLIRLSDKEKQEGLCLVRLGTDRTFRTIVLTISDDDRLEVE